MHRISNGSQVPTLPTPAVVTGTPGFATPGNPGAGLAATTIDSDAFNAQQEELIAVVLAAGLTPSKTNNMQVLAALGILYQAKLGFTPVQLGFTPVQQGTGVGQTSNAVKIGYSASGKTKLTIEATDLGNIALEDWVNGNFANLNQFGLTNYHTQRLPSGLLIKFGSNVVAAFTPVLFPTAFPNAALGLVVCENNAGLDNWGAGRPTIHGYQSLSRTGFNAWGEYWTGSAWNNGTFGQAYIAFGY